MLVRSGADGTDSSFRKLSPSALPEVRLLVALKAGVALQAATVGRQIEACQSAANLLKKNVSKRGLDKAADETE